MMAPPQIWSFNLVYIHANREQKEAREREDALGFFANIFPHKPTPAERNISGASSISAISSTSTYLKERHHSWYNNSHSPRSEDLDEEEEFGRISEVCLVVYVLIGVTLYMFICLYIVIH
jgi:hypothetical protein